MILELYKIKETPVKDDEKFIWLLKSLMTHEIMYPPGTNASNLEYTVSGLHDTEVNKLPFDHFFGMLENAS